MDVDGKKESFRFDTHRRLASILDDSFRLQMIPAKKLAKVNVKDSKVTTAHISRSDPTSAIIIGTGVGETSFTLTAEDQSNETVELKILSLEPSEGKVILSAGETGSLQMKGRPNIQAARNDNDSVITLHPSADLGPAALQVSARNAGIYSVALTSEAGKTETFDVIVSSPHGCWL